MKYLFLVNLIFLFLNAFSQDKKILPGLIDNVEIITDPYGVSHIYAKNENDMFFAQGFQAASDDYFNLNCGEGKQEVLFQKCLVTKKLIKI